MKAAPGITALPVAMTLALALSACASMRDGADSTRTSLSQSTSGAADMASTASAGMGTSGSAATVSGDAGMTGSRSASTAGGSTSATSAASDNTAGGTSAGGTSASGASASDQARGLGMAADTSAAAGAMPADASPPPPPRSVGEALAMVAAVDQHEVRLAQQARSKGVTGPALDYAKMMEAHHAPHLQATQRLLTSAGSPPPSSEGLQTLMRMSQQAQAQLAPLQGQAHARAYIDRMVLDHQMSVQLVDASLPLAREEPVRAHLTATRQTMQQHLQRAREIQTQMKGAGR